jgi:hypothetical protein
MKRMGLDRNRWLDPVDEFVRQHGRFTPRWAIVLTYEIDLDRLGAVLRPLTRRGRCFRCVVISDQATLEEALKRCRTQLPGAVNLHPIRCSRGGVFHPKLVFLRAGRHVRACFGSANITAGGMGSNLELWTFTESAEILGGIQHFLRALIQCPDLGMDDGVRRSLKRATAGLVGNETGSVWSSLQESFASRLKSGPERRASRATIISPMCATEGGIKAAREAVPSTQVKLYTNAAVRVSRSSVFVYSPPHVADQPDDAQPFPSDLHAKAYVFRPAAGGAVFAWTGSANFTAQALTKTVAKGGNVELMVRTVLPKDEADALDTDLKELFENGNGLAGTTYPRVEAPPRAKGTILACELVGSEHEPRLRIHTTQRQGRLVLKNLGRRVNVMIENGQGIVKGAALRRLLPEFDALAARVFVIHQLVGGEEIPVVVNVPHVPPDDAAEGHSHSSIDALLDDLLGRVPISRSNVESDDDNEDGDDVGHDGGDEPDMTEFERPLDQVRHQGEIDRLAVKAALLKRLAVKVTERGAERRSMFADVLEVLLKASPCHLVPAIRSLFDNIDTSEST